MKKLCIEGWRKINHSYAMVNQWQLLHLADLPINISHCEAPYLHSTWNHIKNSSGLNNQQIEKIQAIPTGSLTDTYDVIYRISFPFNINYSRSERTYVFGTSEYQNTDGNFFGDLKSAISNERLKIVTPSHWSKLGFLRAGFADENILIIPHGVESTSFFPSTIDERQRFRASLGIADHEFALLNVSAMTKNKGIHLVILSFMILKRKYPQLRLILKDQASIYGIHASDYLNSFQSLTNGKLLVEQAMSSIVLVSKNLSVSDLRLLYGASDCYVSPYLAEGFNLPPLEAAACGVPIVVTKGGSTDDYFDPLFGLQIESKLKQSNGQVCLEPNLDSLVEALSKVIETAGVYGGHQGCQIAHQKHSWMDVAQKLLLAFEH